MGKLAVDMESGLQFSPPSPERFWKSLAEHLERLRRFFFAGLAQYFFRKKNGPKKNGSPKTLWGHLRGASEFSPWAVLMRRSRGKIPDQVWEPSGVGHASENLWIFQKIGAKNNKALKNSGRPYFWKHFSSLGLQQILHHCNKYKLPICFLKSK